MMNVLTEQHWYQVGYAYPSTPADLGGVEDVSRASFDEHGLQGELGRWEFRR
jgi:hypothetical protein